MQAKLDLKFKEEVSDVPGGENIKRCFQCGTCAASCPIHELDERYNPRKIIRMIILGMRDRVLSSDFIWLCAACYTCHERCPQDVRITDVMNAVRNLAVKNGYIHASYLQQAKLIEETGRLHTLSSFEKKRRETLGLPTMFGDVPEVSEIFKLTGLNKLLRVKEEG